jgi:hypothetical protein
VQATTVARRRTVADNAPRLPLGRGGPMIGPHSIK